MCAARNTIKKMGLHVIPHYLALRARFLQALGHAA
jgi:hypothetical protein